MVHEAVRVKAMLGMSGDLPQSKNSKSVIITSGTQDFQLKRGQFNTNWLFCAAMYGVHTNFAYNSHHVLQEGT